MPSGWNTSFPDDVIWDTAVLSHMVSAARTDVGVMRGKSSFKPDTEFAQPDFNGKSHDIAGLDRVVRYKSSFTGTLLQGDEVLIGKLIAGADVATATGTSTITPPDARAVIAKGSLMEAPRLTWARGGGGTVYVEFPYGFVSEWGIEAEDKDAAEWPVTIMARVDPAAVGYSTDDPDYTVFVVDPA